MFYLYKLLNVPFVNSQQHYPRSPRILVQQILLDAFMKLVLTFETRKRKTRGRLLRMLPGK